MSTFITSPRRGAAAPAETGVEWLRAPRERVVFGLTVAANVVILAIGVAGVMVGATVMNEYPLVAKHADWMRVVALSALFLLPGTALGRQVRFHMTQRTGVRVGPEQFPELHDELLRACRKLDLDPVPELYLGRVTEGTSAAHSIMGMSVVVLDSEIVPEDEGQGMDWLSFAIASALGSIRLGHTRWWVEALTFYSRRVPALRTPLSVQWTYSRDRCAAFVAPDGVRGLLIEVIDKDALPFVDVAPFVRQTERAADAWDRLAAFVRDAPLLTDRARALYDAGLFDRTRDRARCLSVPRTAPTLEGPV